MTEPKRWTEALTEVHVATHQILDEVFAERLRQDKLFGARQSLPDGCDAGGDHSAMLRAQAKVELAMRDGTLTWRDLINEEIAEVRAARTTADLRKELIQAAALMVAQVEDIDRRGAK
jgi:hypothetical protein